MNQAFRILLALALSFPVASSQAAERQLLTGHVPAAAGTASLLGRWSESKQLKLVISLPLRHPETLTNLLERIYDPSSPDFHHYLTPQQFTAQFGPTQGDYDAVKAFAVSNGLTVTGTASNRTILDVQGSVAAINKAFHITLMEYQHPTEARTFFAPKVEPSMDLATPILHISGLDNFTLPHPQAIFKNLNPTGPKPQSQNGSGPNGNYFGRDFHNAYAPDVSMDGAGQSVGLLEFDGYFPQDIAAYENLAGLPHVPLTNVLINLSGAPGAQTLEVSLDIEMTVSMATNLADVIVYEGDTADDILNQMALDDKAQQLSSSWTFTTDATILQIYQQFDLQGQSMFQASGDSDAYPGEPEPPTAVPYITTVGGTLLSMTANGGAYVSESTWNRGGGEGSSGGISSTYLIPSWQKGINMTANQGSTIYRNIPDVAAIADEVFQIGNNGNQGEVVGTSCAAPLWAAFTALANELASSNGLPGVGFLNPALYAVAKGSGYGSAIHDITTGNNESPTSPNRFSAVPGYDLCTGWGSPAGNALVYAIGLPEAMQVLPLAPPPFAGPVGGPFEPSQFTLTLTNSKTAPLNWKVGAVPSWLSFSPASGTLPGGGSIGVNASVNSPATSFAAGSYTATVWFTNTSDNFAQRRVFNLLVVLPPSITSQPTNQSLIEGQTATFAVTTAADSQLAYQWWVNNGSNSTALQNTSRIQGVNAATLTIADVTDSDAAAYFVVVSNVAGMMTSSNAILTLVPSLPVIEVPPADALALPGDVARFTVTAVGSFPLSYQWKFNGTNLINEGVTAGANSNSLAISNVSSGWSGVYTVIISNSLGTNSASASLVVLPVTATNAALNNLFSFAGGSGGENPYAGLMTNRNLPTVFFGSTLQGGTDGDGVIYRMTTNGSATPIVSFTSANGANPYAGLFLGSDNFLYGSTSSGGSDSDGTLFRLSSSGQLTTLDSLAGVTGKVPVASLFQARDNAYYGTSVEGGIFGQGNLFRVTSGGVFSNLISFDGVNGSVPSGALIQDMSSNFFGTTENGGFYGLGTIFQVTPAGRLITWVAFDGTDGESPVAGLTFDAFGNMFGTTFDGGLNGDGEVFVISPDGSGEVLYDFSGPDGANPYGALVLGADGNLFGTTEGGGAFDGGTIFEVSPAGVLQSLASFDGFQGAQPTGALLQFKGAWYGTTITGGANNLGAAYRFAVSGSLQITGQPVDEVADLGGAALFQVATLGAAPVTYQWLKDGTNLSNGAGVTGATARVLAISNAVPSSAGIYAIVVSNSFGAVTSSPALLQVLVSTPIISQQPLDQIVLDGGTALFSVQAFGDFPLSYQWLVNGQPLTNNSRVEGATNDTLIIRQAANSDSGTYSVIVSDDLFNEQSSNAVLLVTPLVAPGFATQTLHSFGAGVDGANPYAALTQARNGFLYGTALGGGVVGAGTIYRVDTNGVMVSLYSFTGQDDGANPFAGLVEGPGANSAFYGAAAAGGADASGALFRLAPNNSVTGSHEFTGGLDGFGPEGTMIFGPDGKLYGTASQGGEFSYGSIFVSTVGGVVTPLYSFAGGVDGAFPLSGLALASDGNFYGCAYQGGVNGLGAVFRFDTNGNFTPLYNFSGSDGAYPLAALIQGADGRLYGTTAVGGAGQYGVVFAMSTNGALTNLFSFDYTDGGIPTAGLVPFGRDAFFGAVQNGGPGGAGGIFKITTNGVWSPLIWFNGANGAYPQSAPTLASDGDYYGATYFGGTNDLGLLYRFSVPTPPDITVQPSDIFAMVDTSTNFSVTALSASPLSYQWFFNGNAITNATNSALDFASVTNGNAGSYFVALNNAGGRVDSRTALLVTLSPPLLDNGGFELGNFTGWTLGGNTNNVTVQSDPADVHSGSFGARLAPSGSLGYLSQSIATTPGSPYNFSFWINSASGSGSNELTALWNGGLIFDQAGFTTSGWSNLQFTVMATNASSSIAIGARDDAGFMALDDVSLTPVPELQSTSVSQDPGDPPQITLHWDVTIGQQYQVQVKGALGAGAWSNLGPPVVVGSGSLDVVDYLTNNQRYYRLLLLP